MSSNNFLCKECAERHAPSGTREIYARSKFEPAEYQRLTLGVAREPTQEQRYIRVNGQHINLDPRYWECDNCSKAVYPGQPCGAWTIWTENQQEPDFWETQYLENQR